MKSILIQFLIFSSLINIPIYSQTIEKGILIEETLYTIEMIDGDFMGSNSPNLRPYIRSLVGT